MPLTAEVYVTPQIDVNPAIRLPFSGSVKWSPISSTLIYGEKEAIHVDTPITIDQNEALAPWIETRLGKDQKLTTVYITHGHRDHFLGLAQLKNRFPGCLAVATPGTVDHMKQQLEPNTFSELWDVYFPIQLPKLATVEIAEPLNTDELFLEGHNVRIIELGQTALFVPAIGLAVCGDAVYGDDVA